jgi:molecular chaperone DnaK
LAGDGFLVLWKVGDVTTIGIDLGTTFSAVAFLDAEGVPRTIPNAEGELTTPSVILFDTETNAIVGRDAKRAALAEPGRVAQDVKRYMGDEYYPHVVAGNQYTPVALSALILKKLRQDAEAQVGAVSGAVITVPAYFDESRREATAEAGRLAGLQVVDIINEPTAAALAHAYRSTGRGNAGEARTVLVYDLGGGTFDVTLLRVKGNDLSVIATMGDICLGGRDWDERVFAHLADAFLQAHGEDPRDDPRSVQQFMQAAEDLKKDLSTRAAARYVVTHNGKAQRGEMTRAVFEQLTADLLFRTESRITRVIRDAALEWKDIDQVLCVGGSTRMPQVTAMLQRVTGKVPDRSLSPEEAVAQGAAIHGAALAAQEAGSAAAQEGGPAGAGGKGSVVKRFSEGLLKLLRGIRTSSVNAHSLGVVVETGQGTKQVSHLIARNTPLPAAAAKCYATVKENQSQVIVQIVEGESKQPEDCLVLGTCRIASLPANLPKGSPVEVSFRYDRSGRLHVSAVHVGTGAWAEARIERRCGLDPARVQLNRDLLSRLTIS